MFKEFKIGKVFKIKKVFGKPLKSYEKGIIPYVSGSQNNNGIVGFVSAPEKDISKGNCISIDPIKGFAFYQPINFVGRGFSGASINLLYNNNLNETISLYLCTVIEKIAKNLASYNNLFNSDRLASALITVPVIPSPNEKHEYTVEDIDWNYMEKRIAELERERIAELEAYLKAAGLENYELTEEDKKVLLEKPVLKEFVIEKLFFSQNGDTDLQKKDINGKGIPVITSGVQNNGILGLTDKKAKIISPNTITVDMFGNVYYRNFEYKMVTHARVFSLEPYKWKLSEKIGLYICSKLKYLTELFSYDNMCSFNKIKGLFIELPVNSSGTPDFDYMERYIRALEKLAIANVVKYKDKVIEISKVIIKE